MKTSSLLKVLFVSAALIASATGCAHQPRGITYIPGGNPPTPPPPAPTAENTAPSTSPGVGISPAPVVTPGEPIPEGTNGPWSGVIASGAEDRGKFSNDTVHFDLDSATIKKSEDSKLDDVAAYFKNNTTDALRVEGHCDERGTEKYNLALGERRAQAVREYLATLGVDSRRLVTVTFGAAKPVDPGHDESAWKKNRRADFILLTPKK